MNLCKEKQVFVEAKMNSKTCRYLQVWSEGIRKPHVAWKGTENQVT